MIMILFFLSFSFCFFFTISQWILYILYNVGGFFFFPFHLCNSFLICWFRMMMMMMGVAWLFVKILNGIRILHVNVA